MNALLANRLSLSLGCLVSWTAALGAPGDDAFLRSRDVRAVAGPEGLSPAARAALRNGMMSSSEPRLGVPTFFWVGQPPAGTRTPRDQGLTAEQVARRTLFTHAELYRADRATWADSRLTQLHQLNDEGAVIAIFQQDVAGVRVFRDEVKVAMTKDYVVVAISGYLTPETKRLGGFSLRPSTAAAAAVSAMTGQGVETSALRPIAFRDGYQLWQLDDEPTPVRARQVWFPLPEGLEPGYYVEVELNEGETDSRYHSFVISARDGQLLYEKNLTADASYRVWAETTGLGLPLDGPSGNVPTPHPAGSPNGYQPPFVAPELVTRDYGPISTMDPWLPANATRTEGNNTFAYIDLARPNGFGAGDIAPTPNGDPDGGIVFDRVYDPLQNPYANESQRMAAATQLFYDINFLHDWYYDRGFDEAAGNAQLSNFGRGGIGNDPINAEGQDNSGTSNANMSTPSDGARPRMQMYVFTGTSTERITYNGANVSANGGQFGPQQYNVTADIVAVNDGDPSGMGGTVTDGCQPNFTVSVMGKIALVDRGLCTFVEKVQIAQTNGAVGIIIVDTSMFGRPLELVGSPMPNTTIPAMSLTRMVGASLRTAINAAANPIAVTLFRQATIDRDGTLDNAIIAHEWGHYISNRLIGDGNGLSARQSAGMGEGWSDFHALLMMVRADDLNVPSNANWMGTWAVGGYTTAATSAQGHYYGVRRVPYTVDFTKNGLTFKHIQRGIPLPQLPTANGLDGSFNAEVHSTGEVWATMLWEAYVALLRDTPRLTFDQAQDRMLRYLVAAYKLTPMMPTFIDARDALLAAAVARDPQDFALFWAAFARRGLGMEARAPDRDAPDNRPAIESFVVGNALQILELTIDDSTTSCDMDGVLDTDEVGMATVSVKNVGVGALTATSVSLSTMSPGLSFPQGPTAMLPTTQPFGTATVRIPVTLRGVRGFQGVVLNVSANDASLATPGPVTKEFRTRINSNTRPNGTATDDVEAPMSRWTTGNDPNGNTGSDWRIAQATATSHYWFGPNPSSPADTFLVSPPLSVGPGPFTMSFKHRFDFEKDTTTFFDGAVLELSVDGRTWTDLGATATPGYTGAMPAQTSNPLRGRRGYVGQSPNYPTFNTERVELGTTYANQMVRVRFRIGSDDAAAAKGWEVDDIEFTGLTQLPFTSVAPDPNTCSGNRAPTLTPPMNLRVREGDAVFLTGSGTDPDGDAVRIVFVQREGPMVDISAGDFTAPEVERTTDLVFDVVATDGALESMPARMTVTVVDSSSAPTVMAPASVEVPEETASSVTATAIDPQGDVVSFTWKQVSGPTIELRDATSDTVRFTTPPVNADVTLVLEVIANDGQSDSVPARVEVLVRDAGLKVLDDSLGKTPTGCVGCSTGADVFALAGLGALFGLRRRRRA
ncbi:MAG: M36 family metallopeptidase [Myxococcales bacterium]|nr:M36 family metallopeptidase [Myxococcales bacterium]